jgi:CspA family cold shock protein
MQKGTVKFYNSEKGFGFIVDDSTKKDVFVHSSGLIDKINQNDKVAFDLEDGKKGKVAVNVELV